MNVAAQLRLFLKPANRGELVRVGCDGVSSLGHVVQSLGIPLTEVGRLAVDGRPVPPRYRPGDGDVVQVGAVDRPQLVPGARFVLDVHLGALARRLRLAGVDAAYANDAADDALVEQANAEWRILLTQDRGLLRRRTLWLGAYVYGARPDDQLADVLDRFTPPLAAWTRCPACNGLLAPVPKAEVAPLLQPGTRRTYQLFSRCDSCGQVYWRGAHAKRLEALIASAQQAVSGTPDDGREPSGGRLRGLHDGCLRMQQSEWTQQSDLSKSGGDRGMNMPVPRRQRPVVRSRGGWPVEFWDPFGDFTPMWNRMAQLFESAGEGGPDSWVPTVETDETDDAYVVRAELPGMKAEDVNVEVTGNELRITGEVKQEEAKKTDAKKADAKKADAKETEGKPLRHRRGRFSYRASLPADADVAKINAQLTDGILTVQVPKAAPSRSRRIEIKG